MKLVIQRVKNASVTVDGKITGKIDEGLLILVGITHSDTRENAEYLAKKACNLRIFHDDIGKMNLSVKDIAGKILAISQFTLYADTKKGNRPSFTEAGEPHMANELYEYFMQRCEDEGVHVEKGIFAADMKVELLNDGPVTIILEK